MRNLCLSLLIIFQAYGSWECTDKHGESSTFAWGSAQDLPAEKELFCKALLEIYKELSLEELGLTCDKREFAEDAFADLEKEFLEGTTKIFTVKKQDKLVGFIAFYPTDTPNQIYFSQMSIDPSYWRRGLGRNLISFLLREFPETDHFVLITRKINTVARQFWKSLGFTECSYMHNGYDPEKYIGYELHPRQLTTKKFCAFFAPMSLTL